MLIAIDIGNTNIVVGLIESDEIKYSWRLDSLARRTEDEWGVFLHNIFSNAGVKISQIRGIIISSVVPHLTSIFKSLSENQFKSKALIIDHTLDTGIEIMYDDPAQVGADRICNAVAGYAIYGGPLVIIDFGTATTFDVISNDGKYLGGIISPGLETASVQLHKRTARLPEVNLDFPQRAIATNTEDSMKVGIMFGAVAQIEGLLNLIEKELGSSVKAVSTGGIGKMMNDNCSSIYEHNPDLTLIGMKAIYDMYNKTN